MEKWRNYWKSETAASSAEFALVVLPFLVLIFGVIQASMIMYANQCLQTATEAAVRCYSVDTVNCGTSTAAQTYAAARYSGPNISPVFVAAIVQRCGHRVTGTANYPLNLIILSPTVALSARACFP
jgi:Flp pilus assembly protein TadG